MLGFGGGLWVAEGRGPRRAPLGGVKSDAGGGVEDAADGPSGFIGGVFFGQGAFIFWQEDFADALLLGPVIPAAEEREVVGEGGEVGG